MPAAGPAREIRTLEERIASFEIKFLKRHLEATTLAPLGDDDLLDVAAYVVLSHGAIEDFVEGLALWLLEKSTAIWTFKQKVRKSTASLLLYSATDQPELVGTRTYDRIRQALESAKVALSRQIRDNNGIGEAHLGKLLGPLGIDVPNDRGLLASLDHLISLRHQWAHSQRFGAEIRPSAQDVRIYVSDCMDIARNLAAQARKLSQ